MTGGGGVKTSRPVRAQTAGRSNARTVSESSIGALGTDRVCRCEQLLAVA